MKEPFYMNFHLKPIILQYTKIPVEQYNPVIQVTGIWGTAPWIAGATVHIVRVSCSVATEHEHFMKNLGTTRRT